MLWCTKNNNDKITTTITCNFLFLMSLSCRFIIMHPKQQRRVHYNNKVKKTNDGSLRGNCTAGFCYHGFNKKAKISFFVKK